MRLVCADSTDGAARLVRGPLLPNLARLVISAAANRKIAAMVVIFCFLFVSEWSETTKELRTGHRGQQKI